MSCFLSFFSQGFSPRDVGCIANNLWLPDIYILIYIYVDYTEGLVQIAEGKSWCKVQYLYLRKVDFGAWRHFSRGLEYKGFQST